MLTGQILLQLIVILLVVQGVGYLCVRLGQQRVIGEILAGLVLGPTLLGAFWPSLEVTIFPGSTLPTLQTLGDIGLILYMFSLGARIDTHALVRQSRKAVLVSFSGIAFPLVTGAAFAFFLYPSFAGPKATPVAFMLLVGTAMAVTAFPVLARLLTEWNMLGTKIGVLALSCAAIDDVVAWCLLALSISLIQAKSPVFFGLTIVCIVGFIALLLGVVRPLLLLVDRRFPSKSLLFVLSIVLLLLSAYTTNAIGIHPVFGAFLMGIVLPRRAIFVELVRSIEQINTLLFLPLYFVYSGLHTRVGLIDSPVLWLICLCVLVIACVGKVLGVTIPLGLVEKSWKEALSLGVLMNTRGLVELIVLNVGLNAGILSPTLFAMLVIMAVLTTMMASPILPLLGYRQKHSPVSVVHQSHEPDVYAEEKGTRTL